MSDKYNKIIENWWLKQVPSTANTFQLSNKLLGWDIPATPARNFIFDRQQREANQSQSN
jgi:hypothetical protein